MLKNVNKLQSKELEVFEKNDLILFVESWLSEEALLSVQVNGFTCYHVNRNLKKRNTKRNSGGLILYIRNELVTDDTLFMTDSDDLMWVRLDGKLFNKQEDIYLLML